MKRIVLNKMRCAMLKNVGAVVLGTALIAIGTAAFLLPFDLVAGGLGGIAVVAANVFDAAEISIDALVTVLSFGFFVLGALTLGKRFAVKTLLSTLLYPLFFALARMLPSQNILAGFFYLQGSQHGQIAIVIAALLGGALIGVGSALAILGGGSSGGVDVLAILISKLYPTVKSSTVIFVMDALTVIAGMLVIGDAVVSMLGVSSAAVSAFAMNKVLLGGERGLVAEIVTERPDNMLRLIIDKLERTATLTGVTGGYTGKQKTRISVSFTIRQYGELLSIVSESDPFAFVTVYRAYSVRGEGWTDGLSGV